MAERKQKPDIVEQLKQMIRDSGLSLNEIARRSGVDEGRLSRFTRGERTLTMPAAAKVCEVLGMSFIQAEPVPPVEQQPEGTGKLAKRKTRGQQ